MSAHLQPTEVPPPVAMLKMLEGFWASRSVYAAAKLGLPDLLKNGAKTLEELASGTGAHAGSLYRLLRALVSIGVFNEDESRRFSLTPLGATLRTDVPGSLRFVVIEELGENHYTAWEKLLYSIRTGDIAFNHIYGKSKWEYMSEHADEARIFDEAMASFGSVVSAAIVQAYDFSASHTVVDVGGGKGSLLAAILQANQEVRGALFDAPHVVEAARDYLTSEGVMPRCEVIGGDFFQSAPSADTYVLRWIIHDWDDERSIAILKNCRKAMSPAGKVLLVEAVLKPGTATSFAKFLDLNMLVMTGGRERTEAEYANLLKAAGLNLTRIIPTRTEMSVIEATRG